MSDDAEINSDPDENRAIAAALVPVLREAQSNLQSLAIDVGKWILTSELAINGAGVLAVWPTDLSPGIRVFSCSAFLLGIIAAMLSGYLGMRTIGKAGKPLSEMIGYWLSVQIDGFRVSTRENFEELEKQIKPRFSNAAGWASVILFVVGAVTAGLGSLGQKTLAITDADLVGKLANIGVTIAS